ncbi:MAG: MerR family transcriptional regulator [Phycisphaerae bacterium]
MESVKIWKVGEIANLTGVSIRTLHHYDEIGLLPPSHRSGAGHRLYTESDVQRLQCILSLRELGFSLEQTAKLLDSAECSLRQVIEMHRAHLRELNERQIKLLGRLDQLHVKLVEAESSDINDLFKLIMEIEMMETFKECYTTEQLESLEKRRREVGPERIEQVQNEWHELIGLVRNEMDAGTDPTEPHVQKLAKRWMGLVAEFTGGRKDIEESLGKVYKKDPNAAAKHGFDIDAAMMQYVGKAWAAHNDPSASA